MQVAAVLRGRITSGELPSGARMPGSRGIKAEFGVSAETAQKSLRVLEEEGVIQKWPGIGYWVIPPEDDDG
jgi:GntR family transcriptional regulator